MLQAVLTDSVLLVDMTQPVPMEEFLQPHAGLLRFADVRACYINGVGGLQKVWRRRRAFEMCRKCDLGIGGSAIM